MRALFFPLDESFVQSSLMLHSWHWSAGNKKAGFDHGSDALKGLKYVLHTSPDLLVLQTYYKVAILESTSHLERELHFSICALPNAPQTKQQAGTTSWRPRGYARGFYPGRTTPSGRRSFCRLLKSCKWNNLSVYRICAIYFSRCCIRYKFSP